MSISKELLSEVLNIELEPRRNELNPIPVGREGKSDVIFYWIKGETHFHNGSSINIHELSHKCKEWAIGQGYIIETSYEGIVESAGSYCIVRVFYDGDKIHDNYTDVQDYQKEPEAIFKACEWILKKCYKNE